MAERACHAFASTTRFGLTQVLDLLMKISRLSKSELAVFFTVLVLHLAAATLIFKVTGREKLREIPDEPLIVHWIQRTPRLNNRPAQPIKSAAIPSRTIRHRTTKEAADIKAQESNRSDAHVSRQLILSAPESAISFEHNPMAKHEKLEATPTRMKVTIIDRSFFGVLQRMTKAQICKDLRMALSKAVGDATTIMTTMQKEGCMRS